MTPPSSVSVRPEIQTAFDSLRANRWELAKTSCETRRQKLRKFREAIAAATSEVQAALESDLRRHRTETELVEVSPTLGEIDHLIKHLDEYMAPRGVATPLAMMPARSELRLEPKGVVLVLSPWNYPFYLCAVPVATAIAAGNAALVKPSELTPATSALLKRLCEAMFAPTEVRVFEGDAAVSQELLQLPFDHFFYTGGGPVGKLVMKAAAEHLSSVTLELGGKSPVILHDSVRDWKRTGERIAWGKWINCGQTCIAPDYALVPRHRERELVAGLKDAVTQFYGSTEEARRQSPDLARIVNDRHFARVKGLVEQTVQAGARVEFGAEFDAATRYVAPTVLTGVRPDHPIMSDEIFGPVLPVLTYDRIEEAYEVIRSKDKPLALYVFAQDEAFIERVLAETTAGGTTINDCALHIANPHLPFGGVGPSGLGRYHGEFGFRELSHERAVLRQSLLSPVRLLQPPYNPRVQTLVKWVQKIL